MSAPELRLDRTAVEAREIDGELVIYDLASRRYLGGNRTAAMLWPLLLEGTDLGALATALERNCGIDPAQAREDVDAFVASLRGLGLLVDAEEQGATAAADPGAAAPG